MNTKNNLLTPEQVAGILQIHVLTVYSYIRQGRLAAIRLGRTYRIVRKDLELFIESNRVEKSTSGTINKRGSLSKSEAHLNSKQYDIG